MGDSLAHEHLVVDARDCAGPLDDIKALETALLEAARAVGATVIRSVSHAYTPHGATVVLLLAESHMMITTWPEADFAIVDVFLCSGLGPAERAWHTVRRHLAPSNETVHRIMHISTTLAF
jgi:S-adenosylmethionine decarboxylase